MAFVALPRHLRLTRDDLADLAACQAECARYPRTECVGVSWTTTNTRCALEFNSQRHPAPAPDGNGHATPTGWTADSAGSGVGYPDGISALSDTEWHSAGQFAQVPLGLSG